MFIIGKSSSQPERQLIREDVESNQPLPRIHVLQPKKPPVLQDKTNRYYNKAALFIIGSLYTNHFNI